jgi:hypothetical protein
MSSYYVPPTTPQKRKRRRDIHPHHENDWSWTDVSSPDDDPIISSTSDGHPNPESFNAPAAPNDNPTDPDDDPIISSISDSNPNPESSDAPPAPNDNPTDTDDILSARKGVYPRDTPVETLFPLARDVAVPAIKHAPPSLFTELIFRHDPPQEWTPEQEEEVAWWIADGLQCMVEIGETAGREIRRVEKADGKVKPVAYLAYTWEVAEDAKEDLGHAFRAISMLNREGVEAYAEKMGAPSVLDIEEWVDTGRYLNDTKKKVYTFVEEKVARGAFFCRESL